MELYKQGKPYREPRGDEGARTWAAANGKYTVKATFVSSDGTMVELKKEDGKVISVALDRLSDEDRAWVRKRVK